MPVVFTRAQQGTTCVLLLHLLVLQCAVAHAAVGQRQTSGSFKTPQHPAALQPPPPAAPAHALDIGMPAVQQPAAMQETGRTVVSWSAGDPDGGSSSGDSGSSSSSPHGAWGLVSSASFPIGVLQGTMSGPAALHAASIGTLGQEHNTDGQGAPAAAAAAAAATAPAPAPAGVSQIPRCVTGAVPESVRQQVEDVVAAANPPMMEIASATPSSLNVNLYVHIIASGNPPTSRLVPSTVLRRQLDTLNRTYTAIGVRFTLKNVTRVNRAAWAAANKASAAERAMKGALRRGGARDLNIYLLRPADSSLGWSNFPWEYKAAERWRDGVVINTGTMPGGPLAPYNLGYTMVHEVGHWLGLLHVFEGGCKTNGDGVLDTQPQRAPAYGCPVGADTCPAHGPDLDPIWNFMGYTDDACMKRFTQGQGRRIQQIWKAYRNNATAINTGGGSTAAAAPVNALAARAALVPAPAITSSGAKATTSPPPAATRPANVLAAPAAPSSSNTALFQSLFADLWGPGVAASSPANQAPPPPSAARPAKQPAPPPRVPAAKPSPPAPGRAMVLATVSNAQAAAGLSAVSSSSGAGGVVYHNFSRSGSIGAAPSSASVDAAGGGGGSGSGGMLRQEPTVPLPVRPVIPTASSAALFSRQVPGMTTQQQQQQEGERVRASLPSPAAEAGAAAANSWGPAPAYRALYRDRR